MNMYGDRCSLPGVSLDAARSVGRAEALHRGEIRFAIETALPPLAVLRGVPAHERAVELFAHLRVWDTAHNNGVLVYVQLADRHVEIVADRGLTGRVSDADWAAVCRLMEQHFAAGRFEAGAVAGVEAIGALLAAHFPAGAAGDLAAANELPDRPALL